MLIEVFHGHLSPNSAHVYARVADLKGGGDYRITGSIRGPECLFARTLPNSHRFVDLGPGDNLLARAVIPDPCFWSPDVPAQYRVSLEVTQNGRSVESVQREFGLRQIITRRNSFYMEGKRWVVRAIHRDAVEEASWEAWREAAAAMVVDRPSDEFCRDASRQGVLLIAVIPSEDVETMVRLAQWSCVAFIAAGDQDLLKAFPPNVIRLSTDFSDEVAPSFESGLARMLDVVRWGTERVGVAAKKQPIVALRRLEGRRPLAEARLECDRLQCDLAPYGDCAGYVV